MVSGDVIDYIKSEKKFFIAEHKKAALCRKGRILNLQGVTFTLYM